LIERITEAANLPKGPYPTQGQLVLNHNACGYNLAFLCKGTGQREISGWLKASEMEEFLLGMLAMLDLPRSYQHWGITVEAGE
jgi:hypothetical protein